MPVPSSLRAVVEGGRRGHGQGLVLDGISQILGVQVLPLMGHDLGGLLAVQHGEVGGHVDVDVAQAPVRREAAVGLRPHDGPSRPPGPSGVGAGAGAGSGAGLARGGAPRGAGAGDHRDGLHQPASPWRSTLLGLLLGAQATAAANRHQGAQDYEGNEHRAHDQERHVDRHCEEEIRALLHTGLGHLKRCKRLLTQGVSFPVKGLAFYQLCYKCYLKKDLLKLSWFPDDQKRHIQNNA